MDLYLEPKGMHLHNVGEGMGCLLKGMRAFLNEVRAPSDLFLPEVSALLWSKPLPTSFL